MDEWNRTYDEMRENIRNAKNNCLKLLNDNTEGYHNITDDTMDLIEETLQKLLKIK